MRRFNSILDRAWAGITHHPGSLLVGLLLLTLFFLYQMVVPGLSLDNSPRSLLISNDLTLRQYHQAIETFGDDRVVILAMMADDIFTPETMARVRALTRRIERVDDVAQAISLTNVESARAVDGSLRVGKLIPAAATAADLKQIARQVAQDRFIVGNLVSRDGKMAAINIFFMPDRGEEVEKQAVAEIERIVKTEFAHQRIYLAGLPYMNHRNDVHVTRDLMKFAPLMVLLIVIMFYLAFRHWRGVVLPLATVTVALIWTFGIMALLGKPLTMVTMMVPVIIMAIGSSYVIHVISQVYLSKRAATNALSREGQRAAVQQALRLIGPAILISGLTTMAGFGSLAFTTIVGMRDMGLFNAIGVCATMILSLTLVPAWLVRLNPTSPPRNHQRPSSPFLDGVLDRIGTIVVRRQKWVYGIVLAAMVAAALGITRLTVNSDHLAFYPLGSEERQGAEMIGAHLGGAAAFRIIVDAPGPQALHRANALSALMALQRFVETLPGIDHTLSIADMVMMTNRLLTSGDPGEVIPRNQAALDEVFSFLAQPASADEVPIKFISDDGSQAQIVVRSTLFGSSEMDRTLRRIAAWCEENLPVGFTAAPTGIFVLLNRTSDSVATQQVRSLVIALLLIFAMIGLLFRSVKLGTVALIPNLVPIVIFFGFMGWTGIPLNLNTSLVASVVLGLAVDNAVHLLRRYRRCCRELADIEQAVRRSLRQSGTPMTFANLTLVFGFAVFALSAFVPVRTGGLLSAVTILACFISDLIFLPVLMTSRQLHVADTSIPGERVSPA